MRRKGILTIFILAIIALYVIIYVVPEVTGMLDSTYVAEYGVLSIYDDTTGYLIRNEEVYAAEHDGMVNRFYAEGDLLRIGASVVNITGVAGGSPSSRLREIRDDLSGSMITEHGNKVIQGGIVSFYVDGYENDLTPDVITGLSQRTLSDVTQDHVVSLGNSTAGGYPIFKIVNTRGWYLIAYIPKDRLNIYPEGKEVNVIFSKSTDTQEEEAAETEEVSDEIAEEDVYGSVEMRVYSVETEGNMIKLTLKSSRFFPGLGELRTAKCRIISDNVRGLLMDNSSVVEVGSTTGVFVKNKTGKYDFTPVNVLGKNDKTTVISDMYYYDKDGVWTRTVDPFDDILRNPEKQLEMEYDEKTEGEG